MGGGASSLKPEATTYYAKVPADGKPGDVISADINGRPVKVRVPPGSSAGQLFRFSAADCITTPSAPGSGAPVPFQPNFGQPAIQLGPSTVGTQGSTNTPVLAPYSNNPQPGMHYTTSPNQAGRPILNQPSTAPPSAGQSLVQQVQQQHVQQAQMQQVQMQQMRPQQPTSTAGMSGAQLVQQFGYHQQQPQQPMMMMPTNTPFPQQHFQQQPHYMMVPQQGQQQMMMVMPQQQQLMMQQQQQQYAAHQQYMQPQQQYAMQPQYGAPQTYMMQQPQPPVQTEIPVATPVLDGYHGGATIVR